MARFPSFSTPHPHLDASIRQDDNIRHPNLSRLSAPQSRGIQKRKKAASWRVGMTPHAARTGVNGESPPAGALAG
ncbi:hypothetical protein [Ktedonospora formicarum]|uniref:Uncharacterized protein n=1 Tax=Ktedonospora formicarum TaxID=2778364 RepID=A0A8J3I9M9_9CHLR|nr:hypothetical protein [Ktedonospora formicarum]GHO49981.1 hypothetical protein KSX_81440 [Ktedonospora formicarum]